MSPGGAVSLVHPTFTNSTLTIHPSLLTNTPEARTFRIRAENYEDAQYIADAVLYYTGHPPFYFRHLNFRYPHLWLNNWRTLSTREMCKAYARSIFETTGFRLQNEREEYIKCVKGHALEAVTRPEATRFLRSFPVVFVVRPTFKNPTVVIRPPKWTDSSFRIRAATYEEAQCITDAVLYYIGCEPVYFGDANLQYLALRVRRTVTLIRGRIRALSTREMCRDHVEGISQIKASSQSKHYMESAKNLVLEAVKSPEVVLFLRSLLLVSLSATQDGKFAVDGSDAVKSHFAGNHDDDPTVCMSGLACSTGVGSDWFDWGIIPLTEHKTSSSMKRYAITLEGFLSTLDEDGQSVCSEEVNSGMALDIESRLEYQHNTGDASQSNGQQLELLSFSEGEADVVSITEKDMMELGNDQQCEVITFPEGEADAVTITKRDMESLQPMMFLSGNIIDFYIKYLEKRLSAEEKLYTYFFSSFFLRNF